MREMLEILKNIINALLTKLFVLQVDVNLLVSDREQVCGMLEKPTCGELFEDVLQEQFLQHYDHYIQICEKNSHLDGKNMDDPFGEKR